MTAPLCIVVKGFPRISETFVTRELEALQDSGLEFTMAALRKPTKDAARVHHRVTAKVNYLPEYLHQEPFRVLSALAKARSFPGYAGAWSLFRQDLRRDLSRNRIRRFGQACVLAAELPAQARHLHAHFIHTPASVARYAATIRGLTFSVSAHAKDIWTSPDWELGEKLAHAQFVCTCNAAGAARLTALSGSKPPHLWPHLAHRMQEPRIPVRTPGPIRMLTVARAVPKKGLSLLLDALALLAPDPAWSWTHIGGGDQLEALRAQVRTHPYKERINLLGAQPHERVLTMMRESDIFVLAAIVADDGDRDGRPNALIEAMGSGLACVATPAGGVPEVLHGEAGILSQPDKEAIARDLAELIRAPAKIEEFRQASLRRSAELTHEGELAFGRLAAALRGASGP
jgi:glycosyltransferase involved in cell wall biosynthesis